MREQGQNRGFCAIWAPWEYPNTQENVIELTEPCKNFTFDGHIDAIWFSIKIGYSNRAHIAQNALFDPKSIFSGLQRWKIAKVVHFDLYPLPRSH